MTRTPIQYLIQGSNGECVVDYDGHVVTRCWFDADNEPHMHNDGSLQWLAMTPAQQELAAYHHVYRFDTVELRAWAKRVRYDLSAVGNIVDVDDIGYSHGRNIYVPADALHRVQTCGNVDPENT